MVRARTDLYHNYYLQQAKHGLQRGGELSAFGGARWQRGHGIGSIFARIRAAIPWFLRKLGFGALRTAVNVGQDVLGGKKIGDVIAPRLMEGVRSTASEVGPRILEGIKSIPGEFGNQSGSGRRLKRLQTGRKFRKVKRQRGSGSDIFD